VDGVKFSHVVLDSTMKKHPHFQQEKCDRSNAISTRTEKSLCSNAEAYTAFYVINLKIMSLKLIKK
jgi:hypothetical protein